MPALQSNKHLDSKAEIDHLDNSPAKLEHGSNETAYVPGTIEEKRLVRKIDIRLIPILWIMFMFNYIDRTNIGVSTHPVLQDFTDCLAQNAKTGGTQKDLKLTSSDYSLVLFNLLCGESSRVYALTFNVDWTGLILLLGIPPQ